MSTIRGITLLEPIGRGGSGVVLRARQDALGRLIAVKVLSQAGQDAEAFARFSRECHALGAVGVHPHIATVYDCGLTGEGDGYLAMELLTGGSLADRLHDGALPWGDAAELGVALAGALETTHRVGVLHRDVKPENVLFDGLGTPKLLDFGIATVPGVAITHTHAVSLTIAHAAPEVLAGAPATAVSDVYSLASTVYAALRGEPAFMRRENETFVPLLARIAAEPPAPLRTYGVPPGVADVVESALDKDPAARPPSAEAFGMLLAAGLEGAGGRRLVPPVLTPTTDGTAPPLLRDTTQPADGTLVGARIGASARAPQSNDAPAAGSRTRSRLAVGVALAVLLLGGMAAYALSRPEGSPTRPGANPGSNPSGTSTPIPSTSGGTGSSQPPVTAPSPPRPGSASYVSTTGGVVPTSVRVTLAWRPGAAGGPVEQYELRATRMSGSVVAGEVIRTTVTATSSSVDVPLPAGAQGWYRWRVRAVGPGGTSSWTDLSARLPDLVGTPGADAVAAARSIGLRTTVRRVAAPDSASRGRVASQSLPAGTHAGGSALLLVVHRLS